MSLRTEAGLRQGISCVPRRCLTERGERCQFCGIDHFDKLFGSPERNRVGLAPRRQVGVRLTHAASGVTTNWLMIRTTQMRPGDRCA